VFKILIRKSEAKYTGVHNIIFMCFGLTNVAAVSHQILKLRMCISIITLIIQHVKSMRRIIFLSAPCLAVPYFSTLAHTRYEFRKKRIQGIHKRMVPFQKLTINLFLILHGHNAHRQQQQLSEFLMGWSQSFNVCALGHTTHIHTDRKPFPAATPSWKLAPRPRSKHEKRTAGSAWEIWRTVVAANGVCCGR